MNRVAILGSTGHIAKGLIENLAGKYDLQLYSRSQDRPLGLFPYEEHDVVINCIGPQENLWLLPGEMFRITERFDNMCIEYLEKNPAALYINFSSGAAYGEIYHLASASSGRPAMFDINGMADSTSNFYGIAKLHAEAKHRALKGLNIVDIRVFSYFSRHLRLDDRSLMAEVINCIREGRELTTSPQDFYRDYIHPKDLAQLVERVMDVHHFNAAFDAYSRKPCGKFELLEYFKREHGLRYRIDPKFRDTSPTGPKMHYYSTNLAAQDIFYAPQYTAMEGIEIEAGKILATD